MALGRKNPEQQLAELHERVAHDREREREVGARRQAVLARAKVIRGELPQARQRAMRDGDQEHVIELQAELDALIGQMEPTVADELLRDAPLDRDVPAGGELAALRQQADDLKHAIRSASSEVQMVYGRELGWFAERAERAADEYREALRLVAAAVEDAIEARDELQAAWRPVSSQLQPRGYRPTLKTTDLASLRGAIQAEMEAAQRPFWYTDERGRRDAHQTPVPQVEILA